MAGPSASIIVRSPGRAPPYSIIRCKPACRDAVQFLPSPAASPAAANKMASSTPLEPPMVWLRVPLTAPKKAPGSASGIRFSCALRFRAAPAIVDPVSPSPVLASSIFRANSLPIRMSQARSAICCKATFLLGCTVRAGKYLGNFRLAGFSCRRAPGQA